MSYYFILLCLLVFASVTSASRRICSLHGPPQALYLFDHVKWGRPPKRTAHPISTLSQKYLRQTSVVVDPPGLRTKRPPPLSPVTRNSPHDIQCRGANPTTGFCTIHVNHSHQVSPWLHAEDSLHPLRLQPKGLIQQINSSQTLRRSIPIGFLGMQGHPGPLGRSHTSPGLLAEPLANLTTSGPRLRERRMSIDQACLIY
jgi:hypothetical protein